MTAIADRHDEPPTSSREQRGRAARDQIIAATTRLTEDREFDELAVLDICIESGISVSSFYHRYRSKDALLQDVHARYMDDVRQNLWARLADVDWQMDDLAALAHEAVRRYVELRFDFAQRFRTMALAEQRHDDLARARRVADEDALDAFAELFATRVEERDRLRVRREAVFIMRVVVLVAQDMTGFGRSFVIDPRAGNDGVLVDQLARMAASYIAPVVEGASSV